MAAESTKRVKAANERRFVPWSNVREDGSWFNFPLDCFLIQEQVEGETETTEVTSQRSKLVMFCAKGSDLWQKTSYGFEHDSAHAYLGTELKEGRAVEVGFTTVSFKGQFDQGGILVRASDQDWLKAGVEVSDGVLYVSAVVTRNGVSDWSTSAWPFEWKDKEEAVISVSRIGDALIVRIKLHEPHTPDTPWRLIRVCPFPTTAILMAGPYSCAPTRDGLYVEFMHYAECNGEELH